jgi:hypothetical protein
MHQQTTGAPIAMVVYNRQYDSRTYGERMEVPRPVMPIIPPVLNTAVLPITAAEDVFRDASPPGLLWPG